MRTCAFHLRTDWPDRPDWVNVKQPKYGGWIDAFIVKYSKCGETMKHNTLSDKKDNQRFVNDHISLPCKEQQLFQSL